MNIGTGRESPVSCTGNDNGFYSFITLKLGQSLVQFPEQGAAEGVKLFGAV